MLNWGRKALLHARVPIMKLLNPTIDFIVMLELVCSGLDILNHPLLV
jgi:hypothetical protein